MSARRIDAPQSETILSGSPQTLKQRLTTKMREIFPRSFTQTTRNAKPHKSKNLSSNPYTKSLTEAW